LAGALALIATISHYRSGGNSGPKTQRSCPATPAHHAESTPAHREGIVRETSSDLGAGCSEEGEGGFRCIARAHWFSARRRVPEPLALLARPQASRAMSSRGNGCIHPGGRELRLMQRGARVLDPMVYGVVLPTNRAESGCYQALHFSPHRSGCKPRPSGSPQTRVDTTTAGQLLWRPGPLARAWARMAGRSARLPVQRSPR
jgi:hypothetical protein